MVALSVLKEKMRSAWGSPRLRNHLWTALAVLMVAAFIAGSIVWQNGGWLHPEPDLFLVDHNDPDRSFVSKVICPHIHDAGLYQGRELSHLLEFMDARFIFWSVSHGFPHFYSVITYCLLFILSLAFWHCSTKYLRLNRLSCLLLLGLFWTTPCIFFSGVYIRDAKQGVGLLLFFLIWFLLKRLAGSGLLQGAPAAPADERQSKLSLWIPAFLLALSLCFMDRQGFFFTAMIAASLLLLGFGPRFADYLLVFTALVTALLVHTGYTRLIAPALIQHLTGFEVSFEYQKLPLDKLVLNPAGYFQQGAALLANNFRYFFGNLAGDAYLPVMCLGAGMFCVFHKAGRQTSPSTSKPNFHLSRGGLLFLFWIGALILMYILMLLRHWVLVWPDIRTHVYWIPSTVLFLLAITFAVHCCTERFKWCPRWAANVILGIALVANFKCLPEHRRIQEKGHLEGYIAFAPSLLDELKRVAATPEGTPPLNTKFDTKKVARTEGFGTDIKNPLMHPGITLEEFANSSHFYNFMRSRRNLDFRQ